MNKTLRLSFALKNTYRVNSILYSLKQIPLLKRLLPERLYQVRGLKVFANIISILWEIISVFGGKLLYFLLMIFGASLLYEQVPADRFFLHALLFLSIIGAFANTHLFNPTRDKYYAIILMRMNARSYTLVNYGYALIKVIVGFLPCSLAFGTLCLVPLWICLLLPFSVAGMKLAVAGFNLWDYERRGNAFNENKLGKLGWGITAVLLALAYGLPAAGITLPIPASAALMAAAILPGLAGLRKVLSFQSYRAVNQELLSKMLHQMDTLKQSAKQSTEKLISADTAITSRRKGFEFLNELFIKRHKKILWSAALKITGVCAFLVLGALLALYLEPAAKPAANEVILTCLPYFAFIMYAINRGTGFTRALFMNCDHSLLTYSFYKQPKFVLRLFQIRLREIMKINAVPASVIGVGLALILWASGGTASPVDYAVLVVSILAMSLFFSVHYLTIYYLLQPYTAGTEMKSGTYRIIMVVTYAVCWVLLQVRMPLLLFGVGCIVFCALYCLVACVLVYRFAPKSFRLRT